MLGNVIATGDEVAVQENKPVRGAGCRSFIAAAAELKRFVRMRQELDGKRGRPGEPADHRRRLIPRAVVDHDHFHFARQCLASQRHETPPEVPRPFIGVDEDADFRPVHGGSLSARIPVQLATGKPAGHNVTCELARRDLTAGGSPLRHRGTPRANR